MFRHVLHPKLVLAAGVPGPVLLNGQLVCEQGVQPNREVAFKEIYNYHVLSVDDFRVTALAAVSHILAADLCDKHIQFANIIFRIHAWLIQQRDQIISGWCPGSSPVPACPSYKQQPDGRANSD